MNFGSVKHQKKKKKIAESAHNDIFVPPFTLKLVPQNLKRWERIRFRFRFDISPIFLGITFIVGQGKHMFDLFPSTEKIERDIEMYQRGDDIVKVFISAVRGSNDSFDNIR